VQSQACLDRECPDTRDTLTYMPGNAKICTEVQLCVPHTQTRLSTSTEIQTTVQRLCHRRATLITW